MLKHTLHRRRMGAGIDVSSLKGGVSSTSYWTSDKVTMSHKCRLFYTIVNSPLKKASWRTSLGGGLDDVPGILGDDDDDDGSGCPVRGCRCLRRFA